MRSVDNKGRPIPWYTYPAIDFLWPRNYHDKSVLEFGSGQYLQFGKYSGSVTLISIEDDEGWFNAIRADAPENLRYQYST